MYVHLSCITHEIKNFLFNQRKLKSYHSAFSTAVTWRHRKWSNFATVQVIGIRAKEFYCWVLSFHLKIAIVHIFQ